jgi:hypothetical protein
MRGILARTRITGPQTPERFRFPCGHIDGRRAVERRIHADGTHAWVTCQRCGVIALVVADRRTAPSKRGPNATEPA